MVLTHFRPKVRNRSIPINVFNNTVTHAESVIIIEIIMTWIVTELKHITHYLVNVFDILVAITLIHPIFRFCKNILH